ncbi:cell wall hydrolase [Pseudomonas sp. P8_250]|uniref:cell wall hydrolase n=1 Tax=Pseudomonas sp. P8_250 TaxID=3043446 RepID=UPI002A371D2D|nr:cell wall hydrolase [Pseudomonas sp. P8_250]MDX9668670.1 cell wall hydrolase [Pseudomonas sp. P8_250]
MDKFDRKEVPVEIRQEVVVPVHVEVKPVITDDFRLYYCKKSGECSKMAEALAYEARSESLIGAIAVGYVILERTRNPERWPKTVRGVVTQKNQFSYLRKRQKSKPKPEDWERAYIASYQILHGEVSNPIGASDHYHTLKVKPKWAKKMQYVATVGSHKFYREK